MAATGRSKRALKRADTGRSKRALKMAATGNVDSIISGVQSILCKSDYVLCL